MEFAIVDIRFYLFNGKKGYTVEYCPSLRKWYVFNDKESGGCLFQHELKKPPKSTDITINAAYVILEHYLETIK